MWEQRECPFANLLGYIVVVAVVGQHTMSAATYIEKHSPLVCRHSIGYVNKSVCQGKGSEKARDFEKDECTYVSRVGDSPSAEVVNIFSFHNAFV